YSQLYNLFLIQLAFCVYSHKETFTILYYLFTNFSHSSIIFFIIIIIKYYYLLQDFCFFFCLTSSIHLSITLYIFLMIVSCSHSKYHCSTHIRQFISKSSYIDRSTFTDDSKHLNIKSLIKNLKNVIIKKLSVSYVTESSIFLFALSVSFSVTLSQSSTPVSVSDSSASTISVSAILTSATSALSDSAVSAFIISSSCFKKMLYRLHKSYFSV
ncbi:hypothetical protein BDFG_07673, partial [Blastomyces dermatitidis ATCC 26199]